MIKGDPNPTNSYKLRNQFLILDQRGSKRELITL